MRWKCLLLSSTCWIAATVSAAGFEISGQLRLESGGKALRASEAVDAVVYFKPRLASPLTATKTQALLTTERKQFQPGVLPILQGTTVRFPNNDPILHNAFSTAVGNAFDTDLYGQGEGATHTFKNVGVVRVYCNVHHSMVAHILVLNTPYFAKPDGSGKFSLKDIPAGDGELFVWHERAPLFRKPIALKANQSEAISLTLSKRKVPPHLNKFGKPYRRVGSGAY
jgi:plastocyanin